MELQNTDNIYHFTYHRLNKLDSLDSKVQTDIVQILQYQLTLRLDTKPGKQGQLTASAGFDRQVFVLTKFWVMMSWATEQQLAADGRANCWPLLAGHKTFKTANKLSEQSRVVEVVGRRAVTFVLCCLSLVSLGLLKIS